MADASIGNAPERTLVPQPHGGALLTPWRKGQSGFAGRRKPPRVLDLLYKRCDDPKEAAKIVDALWSLITEKRDQLSLEALQDLLDRLGLEKRTSKEGEGAAAQATVVNIVRQVSALGIGPDAPADDGTAH